jgi:hypothetical protein
MAVSATEGDEGEESLPSVRKNRKGGGGSFKVTKHGVFSVTLLLLLGGLSLFYDYKITSLQTLLNDEKRSMEQLENIVADHSAVITRFNGTPM